ncbi:hypothetical protein ACNFJ7_09235 [Sphingomonas sp. HT-1]|nr:MULTISPECIES: hypothetical protein [unclassified Sphingomonas]
MQKALVALIAGTVLSGVAAAYAGAYPRPETPIKTVPALERVVVAPR